MGQVSRGSDENPNRFSREIALYIRSLVSTFGESGLCKVTPDFRTRSESINAFSAVLSTEGRVVGPCWEKLKPEGPKGPAPKHLQDKEKGGRSAAPRKTEKGESDKTRLALCRLPGSLPVTYLVIQVGNWSTGSDDVGLIQSTKAPKHLLRGATHKSIPVADKMPFKIRNDEDSYWDPPGDSLSFQKLR